MLILNKGARTDKIWQMHAQDLEKKALLSKALNVPSSVAQILLNRGINSVEEGEAFLNPSISRLHPPLAMKDMEHAVKILLRSIQEEKRIAVYGDYDVDGVTATALLLSVLEQLGAELTYYLPDRLQEGFGLNLAALEYLKSKDIATIVTVDCGINNIEEAAYAREIGMEMIITDHHQPPEVLPDAAAVINPLRKDCTYPFKDLCGVGIAFKLGQALLEQEGDEDAIWSFLDLVALGTVADVVPLLGENRILVAEGLKQMGKTMRPGIRALCMAAGMKNEKLTAEDIAFVIAPRLNAAGRLGDASRSLRLLLAADEKKAKNLAVELQNENSCRRLLEQKVLEEACVLADETMATTEKQEKKTSFLLLAREGWHPGVLGIVASRMVERYSLPVILISCEGEMGKGSGRSIAGFDMITALTQCRSLLSGFGGHAMAVGLTITKENIPLLREELNRLAAEYSEKESLAPIYYVDLQLKPEEITPELVKALEVLEPFGFGNERPIFYSEKWLLEKKREVGKKKQHLQLGLQKNNRYFSAISFNGKEKLPPLSLFRKIDLFFSLSFDQWRGGDNLQLEVYDCVSFDKQTKSGSAVIDVRKIDRKVSYLKNLVSPGKAIVVFVNTVARKKHLEKIFSDRPEIFFSHQGSFPPGIREKPGHVIVYDLPLNEKKLKELLTGFLRNAKDRENLYLHLLYDDQDFLENWKLMRATIPAFSTLEQVYFFLQKLTAGRNISLDEAYNKLSRMLPFVSTKHLLQNSIRILQEAAYLEVSDRELFLKRRSSDYCLLLKNVAAIKSFHEERKKWKQALSYQRFLLAATGEKILYSLTDFTLEAT